MIYQTNIVSIISYSIEKGDFMKKLLLIALLVSNVVWSRQYIQCSRHDSFDGMVINLNDVQSTLFMTNGVHLPPGDELRVLKDLFFSHEESGYHYYETEGDNVVETVQIPSEIIGEYSRSFNVDLTMTRLDSGYQQTSQFSCFSAIYQD